MVSYKQFCKNKFLILLEDRFEDNYWFKLSYQQLIVYIRNGKIPLEKSLILVTKVSEKYRRDSGMLDINKTARLMQLCESANV